MRHLLPLSLAVGAVLLTAAGVDRLAAGNAAAVHAWVLTRGAPGAALARLLRDPDAVLLDTWGGGRLVLLQLPGPRSASLPADAAWLSWRLPPGAVALAGCG